MTSRTLLVASILIGGPAVLASYGYGFVFRPDDVGLLWGGVPEAWRGAYTAWMPLAAAGFLAFSHFVVFRLDPARTRVGPFGYGLFPVLYGAILLGSALWMPLCFALADHPGDRSLWLAIRAVLWVVGLASLALVASLVAVRPERAGPGVVLAAIVFAIQTFVLDALVWPAVHPAG